MGRTLLDKIWDRHVVRDLGDKWVLLHIDRQLLHDFSGPLAVGGLEQRGLTIRNPELAIATADHGVSTKPDRVARVGKFPDRTRDNLKAVADRTGIRFFDLGDEAQGIVHVIAPELGLVVPGATLVCSDSHTCTNGGLGALAIGIGVSESIHALATQTLRAQKPATMRITLDGRAGKGVTPKDLVLDVIRRLGTAAGVGHAVEFAGSAVRNADVEGRLTLCNLAVELGARSGIVAPDETTFTYLEGRRFAPKGRMFAQAVDYWRTLPTDADAYFDRDVTLDVGQVAPTVTWGTSPEHAIGIGDLIPDPATAPDPVTAASWRKALAYMGLEAGRPLEGVPIERVFIGSCANSRISDLREAAAIVKGRSVAAGVAAWVVPGSMQVKRQAEAEGLDQTFRTAGFEWREPGCSMCVAANGDVAAPGTRCVSTSNRNFVGRQGPGARTHLASPAMAAAAAVAGAIADVRRL